MYTECKKKRTLCLGADSGGIYWRKLKKRDPTSQFIQFCIRDQKKNQKKCGVFKF